MLNVVGLMQESGTMQVETQRLILREFHTDWFAMTDKEWPRCKGNFEKWLYSNEKISRSGIK